MKQIKEFESMAELNAVVKALKEIGIKYEAEGHVLYVHTQDIIKTRDVILDTVKEVRGN